MSEISLILLGLAGVAALVGVNALFVAAEFAYVGARRTRIENLASQGNGRARLLLKALRELDAYIATTQLGITMAGIALGWVGEPLLAGLIEPPIEAVFSGATSEAVAHTISVAVTFLVITSLLIIFGELAPKAVTLAQPERVALAVAVPLAVCRTAFRPFVWALNTSGRMVVRALGVRPRSDLEAHMDPDEIELVIEASARAGLLSTSELLLARRALQFSAIQSDQIMVPRTEVVALEVGTSLEHVLEVIQAQPHTRYPVYQGDLDNITGVLDLKEIVMLLQRGEREWLPLVRPAAAVPETLSIEAAVGEMRARRTQLLVLVDEHGGTSGILTADEVLARLLGRWLGGAERERESIRPLATGNLLLSGSALVQDVEDATSLDLASEDYDTVGGFLMARLGRIPAVGDRVEEGTWEFRVTAMDGRRVDRVLAIRRGEARDD